VESDYKLALQGGPSIPFPKLAEHLYIHKCVSQRWLQIFCTSLVISVLDYCLIAWGNLSQNKYKRIDLLLFKAAKTVLPNQKFNKNNRTQLFERMNWLTSAERYELYSLVYVHKNVSNKTSLTTSLLQFFVKIPETERITRMSDCFLLPRMKSEYGKNSYFYQTIKMWNSLPTDVRLCKSSVLFENKIRDILLKCRNDEFVTLDNTRIINCNNY
jgi:hypothetical protein